MNERLMEEVRGKVRRYLHEIAEEFWEVDGIFMLRYGSASIGVEVLPWHKEDVLVRVFSYLAEDVNVDEDLARILLDLNARFPLGAFALGINGSVLFRYSLAGANLDLNELAAAVYTVAVVADAYDDFVRTYREVGSLSVD
ncbi:MAG: YbjN domain-containing protein [Thermotogae bacterium]|nr:YbjN domain-containing protein [Thermotogota bacterium]